MVAVDQVYPGGPLLPQLPLVFREALYPLGQHYKVEGVDVILQQPQEDKGLVQLNQNAENLIVIAVIQLQGLQHLKVPTLKLVVVIQIQDCLR